MGHRSSHFSGGPEWHLWLGHAKRSEKMPPLRPPESLEPPPLKPTPKGRKMLLNHFIPIDVCSVDILVACMRICTIFIGDFFRETHPWEHFGQADKPLITCPKNVNVSGAFWRLKNFNLVRQCWKKQAFNTEWEICNRECFWIRPCLPAEKQGPGRKCSIANGNFKAIMNISQARMFFSYMWRSFFCSGVRARMFYSIYGPSGTSVAI